MSADGVLDVVRPLMLGGVALTSKTGAFVTVRSAPHAQKMVDAVKQEFGLHKLDITVQAAKLFKEKCLQPVLHVNKIDEETLHIKGKGADFLGGFLMSDVFNAASIDDDHYTMTITDLEAHLADFNELADEWGYAYQYTAPSATDAVQPQ